MSRRLGLPKSSTHVIVLTLEKLGYVQKRAGTLHYSLGLKACALGHSMTKNVFVSELALPHMRALADHVHLSVQMAVRDGKPCACIQNVEAPGPIKIDAYIGRRMDLHCTAVAKAIPAFGPDVLQRILSKQVYIRHSPVTRSRRQSSYSGTSSASAKSGRAIDDEEEEPGCDAWPRLSITPTERLPPVCRSLERLRKYRRTGIESIAANLRKSAAGFYAAEHATGAG